MTARRKIKKSNNDIFFFSDDVSNKRKQLDEIRAKYNDISNMIKSAKDSVTIDMPMEEVMRRLMSLPLDSLGDLFDLENGKRLSFTKLYSKRDKINKQNKLREAELIKLKNEISLGEIDVALAKINSVLKKLGVS